MAVKPNWLLAGVSVTVRLLPLPPNTIFAAGTSAGFEELPARVKLAAGVSASLAVNAIPPLELSSLIAWSAIPEIFGAGLTVTFVGDDVALHPFTSVTVTE